MNFHTHRKLQISKQLLHIPLDTKLIKIFAKSENEWISDDGFSLTLHDFQISSKKDNWEKVLWPVTKLEIMNISFHRKMIYFIYQQKCITNLSKTNETRRLRATLHKSPLLAFLHRYSNSTTGTTTNYWDN